MRKAPSRGASACQPTPSPGRDIGSMSLTPMLKPGSRSRRKGTSVLLQPQSPAASKRRAKSVEHLFLAPVWEPAAANGAQSSDSVRRHHIVLCEMPEVDAEQLESLIHSSECSHLLHQSPQDGIAEHYIESAVACFGKVREILAARSQGKMLLQVVIPDEPESSLLAGLSGLLKTAAQENPCLLSQIILTDGRRIRATAGRAIAL